MVCVLQHSLSGINALLDVPTTCTLCVLYTGGAHLPIYVYATHFIKGLSVLKILVYGVLQMITFHLCSQSVLSHLLR